MSERHRDFEDSRITAQKRLKSLERLEALYKLREQAKESNRPSMLKSIEDLIHIERKSLARDMDGEPA